MRSMWTLKQPAATNWDDLTRDICKMTGADGLGETMPNTKFIDKQIRWWKDEV